MSVFMVVFFAWAFVSWTVAVYMIGQGVAENRARRERWAHERGSK